MGFSGGTVETQNTSGVTSHENGTVGTSAIDIPSSAGNVIQAILIDNTDNSKDLLVSFDGGTNYKTITPESILSWLLKGNQTQVKLKASGATTSFEILLNLEEN